MFRRPSEGQSLISYLSEQDFGSCADLEKVRRSEGQIRSLCSVGSGLWELVQCGVSAATVLMRF
jgi:hypothetical protein